MSIVKAKDVKLKVLPVVTACEHKYYYEGPCRFGKGEALEPGYDALANAHRAKAHVDAIKAVAPEGVEIMDKVTITRTDDWDNKEAEWENAAAAAREADVVVLSTSIAADDLAIEFVQRFEKPTIISPDSHASYTAVPAALHSYPGCTGKEYEVYSFIAWDQVGYMLKILRARKVIQTTRILCVTRFGSTTSYSSVDSFINYDLITRKLGTRFRFINIHELLDQMSPAIEGGNPTTPGRKTLDLTDEDIAEANRIADELESGASANSLSRDMLLKSIIAYVTVRKNMDDKDCCGFTAPCPDVCSTRRLNEMQFTFCLTHSLNLEQGIPSCCEYDVSAVLSMQALIAVSGKCPYTGNTLPLKYYESEAGTMVWALGSTPEQVAKLKKMEQGNMYLMQHSIAHRRIHDESKDSVYRLIHFAHDQKFGANIRYDFDADSGRDMTLCRFSPDGSKLFIAPAEVLLGDGYDVPNCAQVLYFRVNDVNDFYQKQCLAGNHVPMVMGSYVKELIDLAKSLGVEPVVAD